MRLKKIVGSSAAVVFALAVAGCGGGGGGGSGTATSAGLSGTVADGLAMANAKVTLESANGTKMDVGTTDASGQFSGFAFPSGFQFPAVMSVTRSDGASVLRAIIPSQSGDTQTANVNPITQAITAQVLPTGKSLASLDVSTGDNGFAKAAKTVVQTAFGTTFDYDTFAGKTFRARTTADSKSGGLADTLIDTIAGMDETRKPEDILASAADTNDPAVSSNLMASPAFQARLAGELVAQGRPSGDVKAMIQAEAVSGSDTTTLLANAETYAKSFEEVYTSASGELTGSDSQKQASMQSIVQSAAAAIAKIVEKKGVSSGTSLANVLTNSMAVVKGPLISIGKTNQGGGNLDLILSATRDQMSDLINDSSVDMTTSGVDTGTLGTQVKNFGELVASAVSQSLSSGQDKSKLSAKEKILIATNMGKGVASSLNAYLSDLSVDTAAMTDDQKATLIKAGNAAKNAATALDAALVEMASNQNSATLDEEVLNSMAGALVTQAAETFKTYDLTVDASAFDAKAGKVLINMAKLVVDNTAAMHSSASVLDTDKQAALANAMAGQLFSELSGLDLTGDTPPDAARNVANNMALAMGPALVEKVGQASTYQGSDLQVLAANVISSATTELKKTATLTGEINAESMAVLRQSASSSAESARDTMETTFKSLVEQGLSLSEITGGLADSGLAGSAMDIVLTQVQSTLASGGDAMKGAARDIAGTAASMASTVLGKGGSLTQVRDSIAAPLAAMAQVGKGEEGQSSEQILQAVRNSANTLGQSALAMSQSKEMSLESMISTAGNIAAIVGTQLSGDAAGALLGSVRGNIAGGGELKLETLAGQLVQYKGDILAQATTQQGLIQGQAQTALQTFVTLPEFIPFTASLFVDAGQVFNGSLPTKSDPSGEVLSFRIVTNGTKGVATILNAATGTFSYKPNPGTTGADSFSFAIKKGLVETPPISLTLNIVNNKPQPPAGSITVDAGKSVNGSVAAPNPEGDILTYRIVQQGLKGTATMDPSTGAFTFAALANANGSDFFLFAVNDGVGDSDPVRMDIAIRGTAGVAAAESTWGTMVWGTGTWSAGY
ncbi:MAG: hypothetical protein HQL07_08195 [Nitrospirae bacterium]|nr:hypothetical protein [Magnetococcales bacterium]